MFCGPRRRSVALPVMQPHVTNNIPRYMLVTDSPGVQGLRVVGQRQYRTWRPLTAAVLVKATIQGEEVWRVARVTYNQSAADVIRGKFLAERVTAIVIPMVRVPR